MFPYLQHNSFLKDKLLLNLIGQADIQGELKIICFLDLHLIAAEKIVSFSENFSHTKRCLLTGNHRHLSLIEARRIVFPL